MEFQKLSFEDKYELGPHIGKGHYATVRCCVDMTTQVSYAAKFIKKKRIASSKIGTSTEGIVREARILKKLDHQNIIKIYEAFDTKAMSILILELVTGGELFEYISNKITLSEEEASKFVQQILLGVHHIHSHNVLHLDLKPENILVEDPETQKIKIIDFGFSKEINDKPILELQGTPEFVAPEIINFEPLTFATDMWSVGIIAFVMLTGTSPFYCDTQNETFNAIVRCELDLDDENCSTISDLAKDFLSSLIVKSPSRRLTSLDCLKHSWIQPEKKTIQRKRNSFISQDRLSRLRNYVVSPSRPTSMILPLHHLNNGDDDNNGDYDVHNFDSCNNRRLQKTNTKINSNASNFCRLSLPVEVECDVDIVDNGESF